MFVGDGSAWRFDDSRAGPKRRQHLPPRRHLRRHQRPPLRQRRARHRPGPNVAMAPTAAANVMRFGAFSTGPGQYWPGTLDDASFYPAALSSSQVQAHYSASVTGSLATSAATAVVTSSATAPVNTTPPAVSGARPAGADADCVDGELVGDGADHLQLPVAALHAARLRRYRRRGREQLSGRGRRCRLELAGAGDRVERVVGVCERRER